MDIDIDKQAADLRCCGNCKHSGAKCSNDRQKVHFGCFATGQLFDDYYLTPEMVCDKWVSDLQNVAWRKRQLELYVIGLDTLPEV